MRGNAIRRARLVSRLLSELRAFGYPALQEVDIERAVAAWERGEPKSDVIGQMVAKILDDTKVLT